MKILKKRKIEQKSENILKQSVSESAARIQMMSEPGKPFPAPQIF